MNPRKSRIVEVTASQSTSLRSLMRIAPSDEFLAVCRAVLGADDPATIISVLESHDLALVERLRAAHADIVDAATSEASSPGDQS